MSRKTLAALALATLIPSCVSTTPAGGKVRVTSNPDVVKGCKFLGNVKATSGWGGSAGTGLASSNTEKTLQNKTVELGGNVVFVVSSGIHASGEAYRCEVVPPEPREEAVNARRPYTRLHRTRIPDPMSRQPLSD